MAWFHFCLANHNDIGKSTLVDMANWFEAGLLDLGHKVTFSDTNVEKSAVNIFWECFAPEMAAEISRSGVEYGIVATEIPDGHAFNWRIEPHWKERFDAFNEVAQGAKFIWTLVESTVPFYSKFCPTSFIELGFSERLIPNYMNNEPQFDYCFFGLRTPYREKVVEKLRKYATVEWPQSFLTPFEVGTLIGKSKIGLNFKQSDQWPIPSPTRLGRLMMAKRAIAAEFVPVATRQGKIAGICPEHYEFHEYALDILGSDWKKRAGMVFEVYREQMPMRDIMERIIDCTVYSSLVDKGSGAVSLDLLDLLPPTLIGTDGIWNYVHWRKGYFALMRELGPVDVTIGIERLLNKHSNKKVLYSNDLDRLRKLIKKIERKKSIARAISYLVSRLKK